MELKRITYNYVDSLRVQTESEVAENDKYILNQKSQGVFVATTDFARGAILLRSCSCPDFSQSVASVHYLPYFIISPACVLVFALVFIKRSPFLMCVLLFVCLTQFSPDTCCVRRPAFAGNQHHVFENTPLWCIASATLQSRTSDNGVQMVRI